MRGKSVALLVLALGCGLVAALGITQVLSRNSSQPAAAETVPVMVAANDIPSYCVVTNEMIKTEEWPKDRIPPGALTRTEDVVGRCAKGRVFAGDLLTNPKLLARGELPTNSTIPKGLRVVTVPVDLSMIAGGLVIPKTRVDVQLFVRKGQDPTVSETMTRTILQDISVFAVNDITTIENHDSKEPQTKSLPMGRTVSLLVTPQQGGIVTAASELGTLRLLLRNADDKEQPKITPVLTRDVLNINDGMNRKKEQSDDTADDGFKALFEHLRKAIDKQQAGGQQPLRPESRWSMRLVNAGEVNDIMLKTSDTAPQAIWSVQGLPEHMRPLPQAPLSAAAAGGGPGPGSGMPQGQPAASGQPSSGGKNDLSHGSVPLN